MTREFPERIPVEILSFGGCPNHDEAIAVVRRAAHALGIAPEIRVVDVPDEEAALRMRFLGSPSIRIGGRDVEPDAEERTDYGLACRVYRTEAGFAGQPDERWVKDALLRIPADATVLRALAAAGIPPERCGRERLRTLDDAERELYRWILRAFAAEGRPTAEATRAAASRIGADYEPALASFAEADLIHVVDGQIAVAYPFSGRPTAHRVEIDGNRVHAMCAVDALGIAPMLRRSIAVASTDPVDGTEVRVSVDADGSASWEPREAVVLAGRACDGTAFQGCCRVLNFFASPAAADGYLSEHRDLDGFPITIPEAVAFGRLVFGRVLDD